MSRIKRIIIELDNLSDSQQLDLWKALWDFASKKLEPEKDLLILSVLKEKEKNKKMANKTLKSSNSKYKEYHFLKEMAKNPLKSSHPICRKRHFLKKIPEKVLKTSHNRHSKYLFLKNTHKIPLKYSI